MSNSFTPKILMVALSLFLGRSTQQQANPFVCVKLALGLPSFSTVALKMYWIAQTHLKM